MTSELALVGDVHGNLDALTGMWRLLTNRGLPNVVFLGDYINKGSDTAGVLEALLGYFDEGYATLLRGNHETELINLLATSDLSTFLKMGGAATIRSYVGGMVGPDVLVDFRARFPERHLHGLKRMPERYETEALLAQHIAPATSTAKFHVSAHTPVGAKPRIGRSSALIDTGCGSQGGRLTALLWPELNYVQVDQDGVFVEDQ